MPPRSAFGTSSWSALNAQMIVKFSVLLIVKCVKLLLEETGQQCLAGRRLGRIEWRIRFLVDSFSEPGHVVQRTWISSHGE